MAFSPWLPVLCLLAEHLPRIEQPARFVAQSMLSSAPFPSDVTSRAPRCCDRTPYFRLTTETLLTDTRARLRRRVTPKTATATMKTTATMTTTTTAIMMRTGAAATSGSGRLLRRRRPERRFLAWLRWVEAGGGEACLCVRVCVPSCMSLSLLFLLHSIGSSGKRPDSFPGTPTPSRVAGGHSICVRVCVRVGWRVASCL